MKHLGSLVSLVMILASACGPDKGDSDGDPSATGTTATGTTGTGTNPTGADTTGADEPTSTGTAGTTGEPAPTSSTGDDATTGPVDPGDFGEMEKCMLTQVCASFLHQDGEAGTEHAGGGFDPVEKCILGGLRDGTPGRYVYGVRLAASNGDIFENYLIHVHADRSVTFARHDLSDLFLGGDEYEKSESYSPAQTCTLADPMVFTSCLTDKDNFDHYACMDLTTWWTGCAEAGPRCE